MDPNTSRFAFVRPSEGDILPLPAASAFSRTSDDAWFINTRLFVPGVGVLLIGARDFHEMATLAGYYDASAIEEIKKDMKAQRELLNAYRNLVNGWRARIKRLNDELSVVRADLEEDAKSPR